VPNEIEQFITKITENFAFLIETPKAEYIASREPCDLTVIEEEFGPSRGYAIATPKGSPFRFRLCKLDSFILLTVVAFYLLIFLPVLQ